MEKVNKDASKNINTKSYWETRFSTGDWEDKGGRIQTANFAEAQVSHFRLNADFDGSLIDFGCGLGDAMPIYRRHFPRAQLKGIDVSEQAIIKCQKYYGHIAEFIHGSFQDVPSSDIIVASNVFEHLSDDISIAESLLSKCRILYIIVPYKELPLCKEHVRSYDENYFHDLGVYEYVIFASKGWSQYNMQLFKLKIRNILRKSLGRPQHSRRTQIMFRFRGNIS